MTVLRKTREAFTNRLIELLYTYAITYVITRTLGPRSGLCTPQAMGDEMRFRV